MANESALQFLGDCSASVDLSAKQFCFVKGAGNRVLTYTQDPTDVAIGVLQNNPTAGVACTVATAGETKLVTGGAVTAFDRLTSDASGRAVTATEDNQWVGAIALEGSSGAGITISALVVQGGGFGSVTAGSGLNNVPLITATTITDRAFFVTKPGIPFKLSSLSGYAVGVTGSVQFDAVICGDNAVVTAGAMTIDGTATKFDLALSRYLVGGVYVEKAAASAIVFSAAHVVTASLFGAILVQVTNAGVISTKVVSGTQAYASAPLAAAALPAADTGNLAIGYIAIAAGGGGFTANTTALTGIATFTSYAAATRASASANAFVAESRVSATLSGTVSGSAASNLVLLYTTDGTGALVNGSVTYGF